MSDEARIVSDPKELAEESAGDGTDIDPLDEQVSRRKPRKKRTVKKR